MLGALTPATSRSNARTLRVENIPASTTKEQLAQQLVGYFPGIDPRDVQVRSLAAAVSSSSNTAPVELTATVSLAGPHALDYQNEAFDEDFSVDPGFLGFTPLNRPTEPVVAESVPLSAKLLKTAAHLQH